MSEVVKILKPAHQVRVKFKTVHQESPSSGGDRQTAEGKEDLGNAGLASQQSSVDLERLLKEEYGKGYRAGAEEAAGRLEEEFKQRQAEGERCVRSLLDVLAEQMNQFQDKADRIIVQLAIQVAERIVKRAVALDTTIVLEQIREAIRHIVGVSTVKIRISPADEEIVRKNRSELLIGVDSVREIVVETDESIERGACILESDHGNVDARIATQMQKIESLFVEHDVHL